MFGSRRRGAGPALAALGIAAIVVASAWAGTEATERVVKGTKRADTLVGSSGKDRIFGYGGDDVLRGLAGNDVLDGGRGHDTISGGPGTDRVLARDGARDRIYCGFGKDT